MQLKVLFITNVPSPYRVDFFNELGKYLNLTVAFEKSTSDERDGSWKNYTFENFEGIILKGIKINSDTAICPGIIDFLKHHKFDHVICANFTSPTGMLAVQYMRKRGINYYLECDGGFAKNGKGVKEGIKRYFITGANGYFSTGATCDEYFITYGADAEKIIRYPFTSVREKDLPINIPERARKDELREKLGMKEEKVALAVGQFIPRKGFDILLKAVSNLPEEVGIYFVGGEPTEEYLLLQNENGLNNVHFVGYKSKTILNEYYYASDVFVLPTREDIWGLVIEEAMAHGLPIISTNRCAAALELVKNDVNGYVVPVEDVDAVSEKIIEVITNPEKQKAFGKKSLNIMRSYTIEAMVQKHMEILRNM